MGLFLHRFGGQPEGDPLKKLLADPTEIPFDQLLIDNTVERDRKLQDEAM
jgi:hypothetical protein